jgi:adenylate cyclase
MCTADLNVVRLVDLKLGYCLKQFKRTKNPNNSYQAGFSEALLESEEIRVKIMLATMLLGTILTTIPILFSRPESANADYARLPSPIWPLVIFVVAAIHESLILIGIKLVRKKKMSVSVRGHLWGRIVEMLTPTAMLLSLAGLAPSPASILTSPMVGLYFVFIIGSCLQLNAKNTLLSGFIASIGYGLLEFLVVKPGDRNEAFWVVPLIQILIVLVTMVATFVSYQTRAMALKALRLIEEKLDLQNVLYRAVSPEIASKLMTDKSAKIAEVKDVSVLFLDIRKFTTFAEHLSPGATAEYLNQVFSIIVGTIEDCGGSVHKFLGDGLMVVFGAPSSTGNDARNTIVCALKIRMRLNEAVRSGNILPTNINIGIHAGSVLAGTVGGATRSEYTIIGDTVNLASRIEQMNKKFNTDILVSQDTLDRITDLPSFLLEIGTVDVPGRTAQVKLYTVNPNDEVIAPLMRWISSAQGARLKA